MCVVFVFPYVCMRTRIRLVSTWIWLVSKNKLRNTILENK